MASSPIVTIAGVTHTMPAFWLNRFPWTRVIVAFAFWSGIGVFFAVRRYVLDGFTEMEALVDSLPTWYAWGLLTPLIIRLDRRFLAGFRFAYRLALHFPLGVIFASAVVMLHLFTEGLLQDLAHVGDSTGANRFGDIGGYVFHIIPVPDTFYFLRRFHMNFFTYALIIGISIAWYYRALLHERELNQTRLEKNLTETRLQVLQSQLNPHFLFNTLHSVSALTDKDPGLARQMLAKLGDLLRFSLSCANRQEVRLEEELEFLRNYLSIEQVRFEDWLTTTIEVEPGITDVLVPSFMLQPIVENSIHHGIAKRAEGGHVHIKVWREDNCLAARVSDNGIGLPTGWNSERDCGCGLANLKRRLEVLYGRHQNFRIANDHDRGVIVEIRLPYRTESEMTSLQPGYDGTEGEMIEVKA